MPPPVKRSPSLNESHYGTTNYSPLRVTEGRSRAEEVLGERRVERRSREEETLGERRVERRSRGDLPKATVETQTQVGFLFIFF